MFIASNQNFHQQFSKIDYISLLWYDYAKILNIIS